MLCTRNRYNLHIALKVVFLSDAEPVKWELGVMVTPSGDAPFPLPLYLSSTHFGRNDVCKAKGRMDLFCNNGIIYSLLIYCSGISGTLQQWSWNDISRQW